MSAGVWKLHDPNRDKTREFDSRAEAEDKRQDLAGLGAEGLEVIPPGKGEDATPDGGVETVEPEVVDNTEPEPEPEPEPEEETGKQVPEMAQDPNADADALDQLGDSLGTDPLSILPSHMIDTIQGQPAVNKRGYAMIAERYGIEVSADIEQFPWDNDEGRCVARATAITEEGKVYSGWATARSEDGDMDEQIIELAETRSLKRAVSWASGVGIVSYQELAGELE